jgi:hypothetical protein
MVPPVDARRKASQDLSIEPEPEDFTEAAPPRPQFAVPGPGPAGLTFADVDTIKRPRIVVPINLEAQRQMELRERQQLAAAEQSTNGRGRSTIEEILPPSRKRRALVAAGLILAFSGMLLATHKYVTSQWNPLSEIARISEPPLIGREGVTTTDVNLRPLANVSQDPIGLAESGSKVKVLSADNNWYEIQVMEHARPKTDPYSSDRGWINKRYVRFD